MKLPDNLRIPFNIRPRKHKERFWLDNCIVEKFGSIIKPHGVVIYCVLARHENYDRRDSFPSQELIMKEAGIGNKRTLNNYLRLLEEIGLVRIIRNNKRKVNIYYLLDPRKINLDRYKIDTINNTDTSGNIVNPQYQNDTPTSVKIDPLNQITNEDKEINFSLNAEGRKRLTNEAERLRLKRPV